MTYRIKIKSTFNTTNIIRDIILEQANIVGLKVAIERATATKMITFKNNQVSITGNENIALQKLVNSYEEIFGPASVDTCLEIIKKYNTIQN